MPTPPTSGPFDPLLRKKEILADLRINSSTLDAWIKAGRFPPPVVLNEGERREIIAWRQSEYLRWKAALPVRQARVITPNAYKKRRRKSVIRPPE